MALRRIGNFRLQLIPMNSFDVNSQIAPRAVRLVAKLAPVVLLPSVGCHVVLQVFVLVESFATGRASQSKRIIVALLMSSQASSA